MALIIGINHETKTVSSNVDNIGLVKKYIDYPDNYQFTINDHPDKVIVFTKAVDADWDVEIKETFQDNSMM